MTTTRSSSCRSFRRTCGCCDTRAELEMLFNLSEQEVPVLASAYMDNALRPLHQLLTDSKGLVTPSTTHEWLHVALSECTQRWMTLIPKNVDLKVDLRARVADICLLFIDVMLAVHSDTMRPSRRSWALWERWRRVWKDWNKPEKAPPQPPQPEPTVDPQMTARSGFSWHWMWNIWGSRYDHGTCEKPVRKQQSFWCTLLFFPPLPQIQKMGLQPGDIAMFSTLMDLVKEARDLAE